VALLAAQFHVESRGTTPVNPFATTPPAGAARKLLDFEELGREVDVNGDTVSSRRTALSPVLIRTKNTAVGIPAHSARHEP
jgi:hypothetical protein